MRRRVLSLQCIQDIRERGLVPQNTPSVFMYILSLGWGSPMSDPQINLSSDEFSWEELVLGRKILVTKLLHRGTLGQLASLRNGKNWPRVLYLPDLLSQTDPCSSQSHCLLLLLSFFSQVDDLSIFCPTAYSCTPKSLGSSPILFFFEVWFTISLWEALHRTSYSTDKA